MLSGYKLRHLRIINHVSQQKIAKWCNVSDRYIRMVESGEEHPSEETYEAWLRCIYGIGEPLPDIPRCNQKRAKKGE